MKTNNLPVPAFKSGVFFLLFFLISLSCSDDDKPHENPDQNDNVTVMTNPSDPMLMLVNDANGYRLEYYGDRDGEGLPAAITHLKVMDNHDTLRYFFDEAGRLSKMVDANGVEIELNWNSPGELILSALSQDGSLQINTLITLDGSGGRLRSQGAPFKQIREGKSIRLITDYPASNAETARMAADGNVTVDVSRCGEPSAATIFVKVREDVSGDYVGDFPAKAIATGKYLTSIPSVQLPVSDNRKYCEALAAAIGVICDVNEVLDAGNAQVICAQLGVITSGIATPAAGIILSSACLGFNVASGVICATAGFGPVSQGDSMIDLVCASKFLDRRYEDLVLIAYAVGIPNNIYSAPYRINGADIPDNSVKMALDLGSKTLVRSLTLTPAAPAPGQDYTAEANLFCVKSGVTVKLSVTGSDGFSDEVVTTISSSEKEAVFYLQVPGADQGVQDVVTLEVLGAGEEGIVRSASLIFN